MGLVSRAESAGVSSKHTAYTYIYYMSTVGEQSDQP